MVMEKEEIKRRSERWGLAASASLCGMKKNSKRRLKRSVF